VTLRILNTKKPIERIIEIQVWLAATHFSQDSLLLLIKILIELINQNIIHNPV